MGVVLAALVAVHGVFPDDFRIDSTTVGLLVLIGGVILSTQLRLVRKHISEFNLFGSGIKFREEVTEAAEQAEALATKTRHQSGELSDMDEPAKSASHSWPVFVDVPDHLRRLVEVDPRLAVVGLGLEVERAIYDLVRGTKLKPARGRPLDLEEAAALLRKHHRIDAEEEGLLAQLMRLRTAALHGADLDVRDARTFLATVESLNDFSLGYSLNLAPNEHWEEQGLACRFEHCIERMPLQREPWEGSCGTFGHNCPGGPAQVQECAANGLFDFPGSAYVDGKLVTPDKSKVSG